MRRKDRKKKRVWKARKGSRFTNKQAQIIGNRVEVLSNRLGIPYAHLPVDAFLEDAMDPRSPLHKFIEWDDKTAADLWRKFQARHLMNHLDIEFVDESGQKRRVKALHSVKVIDDSSGEEVIIGRVYTDREGVAENPNYREQIIEEYSNKLRYWRDSVHLMGMDDVFWGIIQAINDHEAGRVKVPTIEAIKSAVRRSNNGVQPRDFGFKVAVVFLAASYVGIDAKVLSKFTRYSQATIKKIRKACIDSGLWTKKGPKTRWILGSVNTGAFWDAVIKAME